MNDWLHTAISGVLDGQKSLDSFRQLIDGKKSEDPFPDPNSPSFDADFDSWQRNKKEVAGIALDLMDQADEMRRENLDRAILTGWLGLHTARFAGDVAEAMLSVRFGLLLVKAGKPYEAAERFESALPALRENEVHDLLAVAMHDFAEALRHHRQFDRALAAFDELLAIPELSPELRASGQRRRALTLASLGRAEQALDAMRKAVDARRALPGETGNLAASRSELASYLFDYGQIAVKFNRFDDAIQALTESAELRKSIGETFYEAYSLSEVGLAYLKMGESDRGIGYLKEAIQIAGPKPLLQEPVDHWKDVLQFLTASPATSTAAEPEHDDEPAARKIENSATAYRENARALRFVSDAQYTKARTLARRVIEYAQMDRDRDLELGARSIIGGTFFKEQSWAEAIREFQEAVKVADGSGDYRASAMMRQNIASAYSNQGKTQAAIYVLVAGMAFLEQSLKAAQNADTRRQLIAGSLGLYEVYALLATHNEAWKQLADITEHVRARNLYRWLAGQQTLETAHLAEPAKRAAAEQLLELRRVEVELEVGSLTRRISSTELRNLEDRRHQTTLRITELLAGAKLSGQWADGMFGEAVSQRVLHEIAEPDVLIIALFGVGDGVCTAFLQPPAGDGLLVRASGALIPWKRADRLAAIIGFSGAGDPATARGTVALTSRELIPAQPVENEFEVRMKQIRQNFMPLLIDKVREIRPKKVVIVPHRETGLIAYWDLVESCDSIESLSFSPSISALQLCLIRDRQHQGATVIVRDQTGTLPQAGPEVENVRQVRRKNGKVQFASSETEIMRLAQDASLVHIAAHGVFNPKNPYDSGFLLRGRIEGLSARQPGEAVTRRMAEHGQMLTAADCMSALQLQVCRLVVLSTCESGIADDHAGGELTGLPNCMLVAGAKSVIASLWPVHDTAAALLMRYFYQIWEGGAGSEPSPAAALKRARERLRAATVDEAKAVLGEDAQMPSQKYPFDHPVHSDAFHCFGSW